MVIDCISIILSSFLLCFYTIPVLIKIADKYKIYDSPNYIKKHNRNISFLGGISIVISFIIPVSLLMPITIIRPKYYLATYLILMLIIFLYGLGDDFFNYNPKKKFLIQTFLCSLLIYKTEIYLPIEFVFANLNWPSGTSYLITLISMIAIVNALNLIDGSDGLAACISLISCLFFSMNFYLDGNYFFFILALSAFASLTAFLLYNKPPAKIFMGDSGSLFIGLLLATFTFVFIEDKSSNNELDLSKRIILSFSFLSIPILDMVRLFAIRIYNKKSPFQGDNNHIHHIMSKIGFTNNQILLIIVTIQVFIIGIAYISLNKSWIGFIIVSICLYIIIIQILRQLKTYLLNKNYKN